LLVQWNLYHRRRFRRREGDPNAIYSGAFGDLYRG